MAVPSEKGRPFQMQQAFIDAIASTTEKEVKDFETLLQGAGPVQRISKQLRIISARPGPPAYTGPATFDSLHNIMLTWKREDRNYLGSAFENPIAIRCFLYTTTIKPARHNSYGN